MNPVAGCPILIGSSAEGAVGGGELSVRSKDVNPEFSAARGVSTAGFPFEATTGVGKSSSRVRNSSVKPPLPFPPDPAAGAFSKLKMCIRDSFEGSRFYLAISADIRDADLIDRTPQLLKACSATQLETLIRNALPGLRLQHVATPPRSIPVKLRHQYFAIEQGGPVWESVQRARNFAVYAPADLLNPQMELIILLAQPA